MYHIKELISIINDKVSKYSIDNLNVLGLEQESKDFKVKIVLVGSFSAGKSALINSLLDMDVLEEGQRPETAIASELIYDQLEYVEAIKENQVTRYNLESIHDVDVKQYDYLRWHLSNGALTVPLPWLVLSTAEAFIVQLIS